MGRKSRAPHGARGLKRVVITTARDVRASRPTRGAWIETSAWMKSATSTASRPAWGAWIETAGFAGHAVWGTVAPRMGRVD